jgi:C-terminal processing protease CtpA/Prc
MTAIMVDLRSTNAMIIDVRVNHGGEDAFSLAIATYFTDQRRLAVSKFARSVFGATAQVEAYIEPANDTPYLNPVAVIGAPDTASAAEIFLMAMSSLPQTTLVGENSNGVLSDILSKTLPNGWEIGLSNEVYLDSVGVNHEVNGVPPTVTAPTFSLQAMEQGRDIAIDAALETLARMFHPVA